MYGCDNFCTYCIVPMSGDGERSRRPEAILSEARQLVEEGYKGDHFSSGKMSTPTAGAGGEDAGVNFSRSASPAQPDPENSGFGL